MNKELEFWHFIRDSLMRNEAIILLVVGDSKGSSPGRQGYKMAVGADGEFCGTIGGGVMEVRLVEEAKVALSKLLDPTSNCKPQIVVQEHRKNSEHSSGMICSGSQTVIVSKLKLSSLSAIETIITDLQKGGSPWLSISEEWFRAFRGELEPQNSPLPQFEVDGDIFQYSDKLGLKNQLFIIGGGHCALALSELMSRLDFRISIFDDRPELNTLKKNQFADEISIIDGYEQIGVFIPNGDNIYVVVMTLGYKFDEIVIRKLFDKDFKYFGVLGSKAKMKSLLKTLANEGFDKTRLERIHTPIGLPINSRTPEEIAVSIAAEIIAEKNRKSV